MNTGGKIKIGTKLGSRLTVLGLIDGHGPEPVCLVWNHKAWCPMLCKLSRSEQAARREADVLLSLGHPNIARCFGVDGPNRLLLEYFEGPSLHALIKTRPKRRLDVADALRIAIYIGSALSHVHDRGFLHLDVKPSNIVVVEGRPVLCDFDIARRQGDPRPGGVRGTEGYIAPEECLLGELTPAADVFGLGVTLYELLTGKMPFDENGKVDRHLWTLQIPTPLRRYRPGVASGLEKLVMSCLARNPKMRPELAQLLPSLNRYIRRGPKMWPSGFRP